MRSRAAYPYEDGEDPVAPNYERVARALPDDELEDEILGGRGEPGYRSALVAEAERRGQTPPLPS